VRFVQDGARTRVELGELDETRISFADTGLSSLDALAVNTRGEALAATADLTIGALSWVVLPA